MTDSFQTADADSDGPLPDIDQATAVRAAVTIAAAALDAVDARLLLSMLGLLDGGRIVTPPRVPAGLEPRNPKRITRLPGRWW